VTGRVTALSRDGEHFLVEVGGRALTARRLLVATGQFAALGIAVIEPAVTGVEATDSGLTGVRLADGTSVPGLRVAGNLVSMQAQVITAAAAGLTAGAAINADLATADAKRAVNTTKPAGRA
jgi:hypothetical protein